MKFSGQKSAPHVVEILFQHNVRHVVICPGSRSAPLTLSFARHGGFKIYNLIDERSAAYFALGTALALQQPVVIVSTSGTAALNFAPGIAEAYYQHIPLIVITADRPESWIDQQNGQAIHQQDIFRNFIGRSCNLNAELYTTDDLWFTERTVNELVGFAIHHAAPVHINYQIAEPMYNEPYVKTAARKIDFVNATETNVDWNKLIGDHINVALVIGQMPVNDEFKNHIHRIAVQNLALVIAENLSNCDKQSYIHHVSGIIHSVTNHPDLLIYVGGSLVSKQLKKYLTDINAPVIRIQQSEEVVDTFKKNTVVLKGNELKIIDSLAEFLQTKKPVNMVNEWKTLSENYEKRKQQFLSTVDFSDLKVFEFLSSNIPDESIIHLGNSTPVRYAQIFNREFKAGQIYQSNRGVSGIDGSTSTALGYATQSTKLNFLICGELSFQYDVNAFFNSHLPGNLKCIVLNNGGGNIFRIIEGSSEQPELKQHFEMDIPIEFSNMAKHFKLNYYSCRNENELKKIWSKFISNASEPSILEIFTDSEVSATAFKQLNKSIES